MEMEQDTATTKNAGSDCLLTRVELAKVLMVSVSTVDRMLADGEITPIRLRGKLVRFHLADVLGELREKAQMSKHGCTRREPVGGPAKGVCSPGGVPAVAAT